MPLKGVTKFVVGQVIGELTLVSFEGCVKGVSRWLARCSCGTVKSYMATNLARNGKRATRTCGDRTKHPRPNTRHGRCGTKEHRAWKAMNTRCRSTNPKIAKYYKDRGITVCEEWQHSFAAFFEHIGPAPTGHRISVDRIKNDLGYQPGNVRWATQKQQVHNSRRFIRNRSAA